MQRSNLRGIQLERLRATIARCRQKLPLYRSRLEKAKVSSDDIRSLDDVRRLPFTTKKDLQQCYPLEFLAVPPGRVACINALSGGDDRPTLFAYTQQDLETWSTLVARVLSMAGVNSDSLVQVAFGHGLLAEGFGLHQGVERIGAQLLPVSVSDTRRQVRLIKDLGTSHLACSPTYSLQIIAAAEELGVKLGRTGLKAGILGGEPWPEMTRLAIESQLGVETFDHYGPPELLSAGVAGECQARDGLHIFEDNFLAEVIDPDTGEPVPEGASGELVLTSLTLEACPFLRYRTGDITAITRHPCECGRTFIRMQRVTDRTDDMLTVRGVSFFPSQIEQVLFEAAGKVPHYQIVLTRMEPTEDFEIRIEVAEELLSDTMKSLRHLEADLQTRLRRWLDLSVKVSFVEPGTLPAAETVSARVVSGFDE